MGIVRRALVLAIVLALAITGGVSICFLVGKFDNAGIQRECNAYHMYYGVGFVGVTKFSVWS